MNKILSIATLVGFALVSSKPALAEKPDGKPLFDFRKAAPSGAWPEVNDGVMGGVSRGNSKIRNNTLFFSGTLSLENNGGFSSVRQPTDLDLEGFKGIRLRVKGDGRTYQLRLQTDSRYRDWPVSYSGDFKTKKGKWIEVGVPFSSLRQSFRGRNLSDYPFDPANIELIGLIIADKKPGPFALEVEWIKAYH
ncbi:MAG: CIA30 family protein [Verrucomicrobiota bacterium]